jgi:hypothetical protein
MRTLRKKNARETGLWWLDIGLEFIDKMADYFSKTR